MSSGGNPPAGAGISGATGVVKAPSGGLPEGITGATRKLSLSNGGLPEGITGAAGALRLPNNGGLPEGITGAGRLVLPNNGGLPEGITGAAGKLSVCNLLLLLRCSSLLEPTAMRAELITTRSARDIPLLCAKKAGSPVVRFAAC